MEVNKLNMFILNFRVFNYQARRVPQPFFNRFGQGGINIYANNVFIGVRSGSAYNGFVGRPVQTLPAFAYVPRVQYGYGNNPTPMQVALSYFPTNANGVPRLNWVDPRNGNPLLNPWEAQAFGPLIRGLFPGRDV